MNRETITFGKYEWLILDIKDDCALLLSKDIIAEMPYHEEWEDITWKECSLREWLNTEFLNSFTEQEQVRIMLKTQKNEESLSLCTLGYDTKDKIFLLSPEEVDQYFSNSEHRISRFNNKPSFWWLRSASCRDIDATHVDADGSVHTLGFLLRNGSGGVRPALWLNLKS